MKEQTIAVTLGCLLHDVGKLCHRAGDSGKHSAAGYRFLNAAWNGYGAAQVLDCLRWHHSAQLREAAPAPDSIAYIAWIADNISAAADRRALDEEGGFARYMPLSPVFTHLNGLHNKRALSPKPQDGTLRMPMPGAVSLSAGDYAEICRRLEEQLRNLPPKEEWINSLLALLESLTSSVPSSTNTGESPDISLYDHAKICAAVGACISEYLCAQGTKDYKETIWRNEAAFRAEKAFLLYSADFSGIQKFIYTVSTKHALRSLRSRSFFLELAMEHYIDELLTACGLSRANLLYSGGGHCYLLLPNTAAVKTAVEEWNTRFNGWLFSQFGVSLYLADGFTVCSADDLTNTPVEAMPYQAMFGRVASAVAKKKLHRYSAQQIIRMNRAEQKQSGRECRVCGRSDVLIETEDGGSLCPWCSVFENLSFKIQRSRVYVVFDGECADADFVLPAACGKASFLFTDEDSARSMLRQEGRVLRIYTKNETFSGLKYSTRLYVGDYAASNSLMQLASGSEGVRRLAVCRMDVDNLGQAFVSGFEKPDGKTAAERQHFVTISRTAAFSRQMSLFFKLYINSILSGQYGNKDSLNVAIVYSGGDDVFLVGAWNDTIEAARRIRSALREFSCGALTISGGIGVFDEHYPIRLAAQKTAELEDEAKEVPGKDAVSLFASGSGNTYSWEVFERSVLEEKLAELDRFFAGDKTQRGTAFLYRILELLRQAQADPAQKLPLARIAYMLARLEPSRAAPNYKHYKQFQSKVFSWALTSGDRAALITAIYLFVYQNRREDR